jgi:hypothetical protein
VVPDFARARNESKRPRLLFFVMYAVSIVLWSLVGPSTGEETPAVSLLSQAIDNAHHPDRSRLFLIPYCLDRRYRASFLLKGVEESHVQSDRSAVGNPISRRYLARACAKGRTRRDVGASERGAIAGRLSAIFCLGGRLPYPRCRWP